LIRKSFYVELYALQFLAEFPQSLYFLLVVAQRVHLLQGSVAVVVGSASDLLEFYSGDVLAPASLSTYRQQQKHLKQVIPETPVPNSESTIPGCREAVLMCLWLLSLSARAEVNITLASLELV